MNIKRFEIWLADLSPRFGTERGKIRPIVVIQTDLLNNVHPSTIICPLSSNVEPKSNILRVHLKKGMASLDKDCDILTDQIRSIDNRRLIKKMGSLPESTSEILKKNISIVLDL